MTPLMAAAVRKGVSAQLDLFDYFLEVWRP